MRRDYVPNVPGGSSTYLRLKGLWNDPNSGRFIKRGFSGAKARAMDPSLRPGMRTLARVRDGDGPALVRVADNLMSKSGIFRGEIVRAEYLDDQFARVRIDGGNGKRFYKVRWERFDDDYVPSPNDRARGDMDRPAAPAEIPGAPGYAEIVNNWGDGQRVADIARRRYGSFTTDDLRDPAKVGEFLAAVGRAAQDADAYRRANPQAVAAGRVPPRFPVEALIVDADNLPDMASTPGNEDVLGAWRLADSVAAFHLTPQLGEAWRSMETSYAALGIRDLNPAMGYEFDQDDRHFDGPRIARSVETSPLMQRMTATMGQPEVSTGKVKDRSMLAEMQTDLAHMEPDSTRLFLTRTMTGRKDRPADPIPLRERLRVGNAGLELVASGEFTYDESWAGTVRHEYGHYLDNLYQSAYKTYAFDDTAKARQRLDILALLGSLGAGGVPPWLLPFLSRYGSSSPDEAFAELWALISHPDYPALKAELEAKVVSPDSRAAKQLMFLDMIEAYFSPDSKPFF